MSRNRSLACINIIHYLSVYTLCLLREEGKRPKFREEFAERRGSDSPSTCSVSPLRLNTSLPFLTSLQGMSFRFGSPEDVTVAQLLLWNTTSAPSAFAHLRDILELEIEGAPVAPYIIKTSIFGTVLYSMCVT